jgi:hypothetical protein
MFNHLFRLILHWTGADDTSGLQYGFWSGFGSDLMELALIGYIWQALNCHASRCYRLGLHHVQGTPYRVCRKHHPVLKGKVSWELIHLAHHKAIKEGIKNGRRS